MLCGLEPQSMTADHNGSRSSTRNASMTVLRCRTVFLIGPGCLSSLCRPLQCLIFIGYSFMNEHIDIAMLRRSVASARSEEHTSELQSLMRISYAVFCLKKKHTTV